mmetsp:Transcript_14583/g.39472  ORF Transcript_14583/g.39472 Transcript_14583/m.39472 type:complete len:122 (+) Transcript_14583:319-684(+)
MACEARALTELVKRAATAGNTVSRAQLPACLRSHPSNGFTALGAPQVCASASVHVHRHCVQDSSRGRSWERACLRGGTTSTHEIAGCVHEVCVLILGHVCPDSMPSLLALTLEEAYVCLNC